MHFDKPRSAGNGASVQGALYPSITYPRSTRGRALLWVNVAGHSRGSGAEGALGSQAARHARSATAIRRARKVARKKLERDGTL